MNAIQTLKKQLKKRFRNANVELDAPGSPDGNWFLDFSDGDCTLNVEWRPKQGFGISSGSQSGFGEGPDEVYPDEESVYCRIVSLILSGATTSSLDSVRLSELRQARGISQVELASAMKRQQAAVSKLERRNNVQVGTLREAIRAMGGNLRIVAQFPDGTRQPLHFDEQEVAELEQELV